MTYGVGFVVGLAPGPPKELMVKMTRVQEYVVRASPFLMWWSLLLRVSSIGRRAGC